MSIPPYVPGGGGAGGGYIWLVHKNDDDIYTDRL